jgi:hypothetical protein
VRRIHVALEELSQAAVHVSLPVVNQLISDTTECYDIFLFARHPRPMQETMPSTLERYSRYAVGQFIVKVAEFSKHFPNRRFLRDGVEVEDGEHYRYEKCREVSCAYPIRRYLLTFTPQLRCADCNNKYGATICEQHRSLGPQKMNKFYSRDCMMCGESDLAELVAVPCGMSSYVLLFKDLLLTLSVLEKGTLLVKNAC